MGTTPLLPQHPLLSQTCHGCECGAPDPAGMCLLQQTWILIHTEDSLHILRVGLGTLEKQKTHRDVLKPVFLSGKSVLGRRRVEVGVNIVSPEHKFRIFPGKGTFHPGKAPTLSLRQSFISQRALGDLGHGQPTRWVAEVPWGLMRDLMKLTCLTKGARRSKEGWWLSREIQ